MTIRIVTDSACDLTAAELADHGIGLVPLSIRFGDEEFVDHVELSVDQFYEKMDASDVLPETAAPAPGAFEQEFRRLADEGATGIVCINLSLELSATGQAARNAAIAMEDTLPVVVFDSKSVSAGLGTMVLLAAEHAASGASIDEIVANLEDIRARTRVWGVLDTLDNLKKGGRIGGAQALVGSMLSIKPCVDLSSGVVVEAGKQRTRKKALAWLRDQLVEAGDVSHVVLVDGKAGDFDAFKALIDPVRPVDSCRTAIIGPVIGTHGGRGVSAVTYLLPPS